MCINSITNEEKAHTIKYNWLAPCSFCMPGSLFMGRMEPTSMSTYTSTSMPKHTHISSSQLTLMHEIEQNYGISVRRVEKIKNAYKLDTVDGLKCFKYSRYDPRQYEFILGALEHLQERGFRHMLPPIPLKDGRRHIEFEKGSGYLCDWIPAREAVFSDPGDLRQCIECLGELHLASEGFDYRYSCGNRNLYGKWPARFLHRCEDLLRFKAMIEKKDPASRGEFDRLYRNEIDECYKLGLKVSRSLERSCYQEIMGIHRQISRFCHHDTANHNFLITQDNEIYLIDFDYCIYDSNLHDIGSFLIRNLRHGCWSMERAKMILQLFAAHQELTKAELELLSLFISFPQDFWQIGLQYYVERQQWDEEVFLKRLHRILEDSDRRGAFIKQLEGGSLLDLV